MTLTEPGGGSILFKAWSEVPIAGDRVELLLGVDAVLQTSCSINATVETCYAENDSLELIGDGFALSEFESTRIQSPSGTYDVHLLGARRLGEFLASETCLPAHASQGTLLWLFLVAVR